MRMLYRRRDHLREVAENWNGKPAARSYTRSELSAVTWAIEVIEQILGPSEQQKESHHERTNHRASDSR